MLFKFAAFFLRRGLSRESRAPAASGRPKRLCSELGLRGALLLLLLLLGGGAELRARLPRPCGTVGAERRCRRPRAGEVGRLAPGGAQRSRLQ